MTRLQSVSVRRTRFLPHLDPAQEGDAQFFTAFISLLHGRGGRLRLRALRELWQAGRMRMQQARKKP